MEKGWGAIGPQSSQLPLPSRCSNGTQIVGGGWYWVTLGAAQRGFPPKTAGSEDSRETRARGRSIVPLVLLGGFYFPSLALLQSRAGLGFHDQQHSHGGTTTNLTCCGPDTDFAEARQPVPPQQTTIEQQTPRDRDRAHRVAAGAQVLGSTCATTQPALLAAP